MTFEESNKYECFLLSPYKNNASFARLVSLESVVAITSGRSGCFLVGSQELFHANRSKILTWHRIQIYFRREKEQQHTELTWPTLKEEWLFYLDLYSKSFFSFKNPFHWDKYRQRVHQLDTWGCRPINHKPATTLSAMCLHWACTIEVASVINWRGSARWQLVYWFIKSICQ